MEQDFHRIRLLPPYVFAEVNEMKARARAAGKDVIDFGMGNPDLPTPPHIVEKLAEAAQNPRTHRYSASRGIPGLRRAHAAYYARRFGVDIDPETEVIVTLGSKEGFASLAQAICAPGDSVIVPNPTYPIHAFGFLLAGALIRHLPVGPTDDFMERFEHAVRFSLPPPLALVLNYPANPTAQVVDLGFYEEVVRFCRDRGIYVLSDLAYSEIFFEDAPPSILQVPGAKEIAVEFTSMSKTYSMPGWRIGFVAGNPRIIAAITRIKSYLDYGAFTPIQVAAAAALNGPQECVEEMRNTYRGRRDVLVESFGQAGWDIPPPPATMFAWAPIPERFAHLGSLEFSKLLLSEADIAVSPGLGFGEYGDGFVRIAMVENRQRIRQAARNLRRFLIDADAAADPAPRRAVAS